MPLATLVSASLPPIPSGQPAILSPEGRKRYFVVHGGLFSRDGVTLDEIRKVQRIGQQPGNDGLMCEVRQTYQLNSSFVSSLFISFCGQTRKKCQVVALASG